MRIALHCERLEEMPLLAGQFREQAAYRTDERLEFHTFSSINELASFLDLEDALDIVCVDLAGEGAIRLCERIRRQHPESFLVLIADSGISPVTYMKPTIMASSLLLRPFGEGEVRAVAKPLIDMISEGRESPGEVLILKTREGKNRIPYSTILYLESRNKRIYLCTAAREYSFYSTIEQMETKLPGNFVRCHRSYIVNQICIEKMQLSKGILVLAGGVRIPVSRKYKSVLKECMP